jgi:hypothetical protein
MIRTAVLAAFALGALATPALAFGVSSAPAPRFDTPGFVNGAKVLGMMPGTTSEPFHFGPAEPQPLAPDLQDSKKPTVVYDLSSGRPADHVDVTDPRDNPFMPQPERPSRRSAQASH